MSTALTNETNADAKVTEFITVKIADQLFGLPILKVEDVFSPQGLTEVPLSLPEVAGVLNLRGRIVTAINMRTRLQMIERRADEASMAVGIEYKGESYGLLIDSVGEVLRLREDALEPNPTNLNPNWSAVSAGVYQLSGELMVVLDVSRVLQLGPEKQEIAA
jgi:purine-binding chemotaxis protein CheW